MRITFAYVAELAKQHGYHVDKESSNRYTLWSNEKMPGVEEEETTVAEIYSLLYWRLVDEKSIPDPRKKKKQTYKPSDDSLEYHQSFS